MFAGASMHFVIEVINKAPPSLIVCASLSSIWINVLYQMISYFEVVRVVECTFQLTLSIALPGM